MLKTLQHQGKKQENFMSHKIEVYRYIISRLVVGIYKQVTNSPKFLWYLRRSVFETEWSTLIVDAKHAIRDTDGKIFDAFSRPVTNSNISGILRNLEHRIKTGFSMVFPEFRENLSRYFRININLDVNFLSGTDILVDLKWEDICDDEDLKSMVFNIMGELQGMDMEPHQIENLIKVLKYHFFD